MLADSCDSFKITDALKSKIQGSQKDPLSLLIPFLELSAKSCEHTSNGQPLSCDFCKTFASLTLYALNTWETHIKGEKIAVEVPSDRVELNDENAPIKENFNVQKETLEETQVLYHCKLCNLEYTSRKSWKDHLKGKLVAQEGI